MPAETNLVAVGILAAILIPVVLLINAVLIRAAVYFHNRFVGGPEAPRAVPAPSLKRAVGIAIVISVVNWLAATLTNSDPIMLAPSFAAQLLVMAAGLKYLLPTRFLRALSVTACHTMLVICVGATALVVGIAGAALIAAVM